MYTSLSPGNIGISLPWEQCLPLARDAGFDAIDIPLDLQKSSAYYKDLLASHKLRPGGTVLPIDFRAEQTKYDAALQDLPRYAALAQSIGLTRFYMWILPFHDTRTYKQNYAFHIERLTPAARILADHGCRLALEFVGPRSMRVGHPYPFVRTLEGMLDLTDKIGDNCGVLLDSWHLYTSLGTPEDIRALSPGQVIYVHVNDAPAGITVDQQIDNQRRLPASTGVQDINAFIAALRHIRYDGPIVAEPFDKTLQQLPPQESTRLTIESLKRILA